MNNKLPVLEVHNLGKSYWLYPSDRKRLLGSFISPKHIKGVHGFQALTGLNFKLYSGQALALIGKNGAGKSTALQILAGILQPTEGEFTVHGRVGALLELGSGFNPEYTGRENIAIAGSLAGLTKAEIVRNEQSIISFADIGNFIDQPVKFYSSGMFVRLAFAIAIASQPDLLIVDEALAVGDIFFRQKCYARLHEMRKNGMAVLLVTHNAADVVEFCNNALLLHNGSQLFLGDCKDALMHYYSLEHNDIATKTLSVDKTQLTAIQSDESNYSSENNAALWIHRNDTIKLDPEKQIISKPGSFIKQLLITNSDGSFTTSFTQGEKAFFHIEYYIANDIYTPVAGYVIWNSRNIPVHGKNFLHDELMLPDYVTAGTSILVSTEIIMDLQLGEYTLNFGLSHIPPIKNKFSSIDEVGERIVHAQNCFAFSVLPNVNKGLLPTLHHGIANLPSKQSISFISSDKKAHSL